MTVCDVILHPERKISDGFAGFRFERVLVGIMSELDVECILVLLRNARRWNTISNGRDTFTSGGIDVSYGEVSVMMMSESGVNDHHCHRVDLQVIECRLSIQE